MTVKKNSIPRRIDADLDAWINEIAEQNKISIIEASRQLARLKNQMKGSKLKNEIRF